MPTSLVVLLIAALMTAGAAWWGLRAYRRAGGGERSARPALAVCAATALAALGVYLVIGRPELSDRPFQPRLQALIEAFQSGAPPAVAPDEYLALWTHIAQQNPTDATPHVEAAKVLLSLGRAREAAREFDQALRRDPVSAEALLGMGRAIFELEGRVTPEALAYFQQAGEHGDDPVPWIYLAMAAMQEERDARPYWRQALARMSADDPRRQMAQQQSEP